MQDLYNYFENLISIFEEEDIVDLYISKDVKFEDLNQFKNTTLYDLKDGHCYETHNNRFTIKIKNPDNNSYYFYNFYYTEDSKQEVKLVFGICSIEIEDDNNYEEIILNNISEEKLKTTLSDITLRDIYQSHNASVKIDIPIRVRNIFFNAILSFILKYNLIQKSITYRGHLEPTEIPFAKLANYVNVEGKGIQLETLKKIIIKQLEDSKIYTNNSLRIINSYIKQHNINKKEDFLNKQMIDDILDKIDIDKFDSLHSHIGDVTYGRGGISFAGFKQKLENKKFQELSDFFEFFLEKIVFFENKIKGIKAKTISDFIKQFNMSLIKLRSELFHRDRLYRLIIRRILKINTLLKDEIIFDTNKDISNLSIKDIKNEMLNNIIEMLKRKTVQAKVILHGNKNSKFILQPKNFQLPIYNQNLENDLKDYFNLLDDELFSKSKIPSTIKMLFNDISDFIINNIVVNNPTGWVNVNTSSKIFNDLTDSVEVIDGKIFNPRKNKMTKISTQKYRNILDKEFKRSK